MSTAPLILHATAVCMGDRGLLIRGASGSGKSSLGLQLMALGAELVADDRVIVTLRGDRLEMTCPEEIKGMIEARGMGLLHAEPRETADLSVIVDLDQTETQRLPPRRSEDLLGQCVPVLHKSASATFPAALQQYLKAGRKE
ncbi:MAG: HPr kinase/phosphatase C-terminal domain-containing protein [Paracoccaceae bacterium]|nr:HPr kinase/phosphatase C-terminal domain-containing protein [Paracoccaceae bacterium]